MTASTGAVGKIQILYAAEGLFFERSFDGVGVDEIGKAAGLSGSAIYRHFSGKYEILAVLFDQAIDALLALLPAEPSDPFAQLAGLVRAHVGFAHSHPRLAAVWTREQRCLAEPYRRAHHRRLQHYTDMWIECLSRCYPGRGRNELVAAVGGVHALLVSDAIRNPKRRSTKTNAMLANMALAGLNALQVRGKSQSGFVS